jgi:hypothetical protein
MGTGRNGSRALPSAPLAWRARDQRDVLGIRAGTEGAGDALARRDGAHDARQGGLDSETVGEAKRGEDRKARSMQQGLGAEHLESGGARRGRGITKTERDARLERHGAGRAQDAGREGRAKSDHRIVEIVESDDGQAARAKHAADLAERDPDLVEVVEVVERGQGDDRAESSAGKRQRAHIGANGPGGGGQARRRTANDVGIDVHADRVATAPAYRAEKRMGAGGLLEEIGLEDGLDEVE